MKELHLGRLRHADFCFFVGNDVESGSVHAFVAIDVVDVPVRVDERMRRIGADRGNGFADVGNRSGETGIDENVAVFAALDGHIAAGALQQPEVVVKLGGLDRRRCAGCAHLREAIGWGRLRRPGQPSSGEQATRRRPLRPDAENFCDSIRLSS